jgi:parallel beta-helix repeat protein
MNMRNLRSKYLNPASIRAAAFLLAITATVAESVMAGKLTRANSPYVINGDLRVPAGDSLLIEPGVELRFGASSSFIVDGILIAQGTEEDSIFFTANGASPTPGSWNGVFLYNAPARTLRHLVISYASTGVTCDGGAPILERSRISQNLNGMDFLNGTTAQIRNSIFLQNENAAIRCIGASPKIAANVIWQNALTGFESAVVCNAATPRIQYNLIIFNGRSGIDCANGSTAQIYQNTLANNELGITISDSNPLIYNNIVTGSSAGISAESSEPEIFFNNVFGNSDGNFLDCPEGVGEAVTTNFNGDASDVFSNISLNPVYVNPVNNDFRIGAGSPCIDAGSPQNPGGGLFTGQHPDIGFLESDGTISEVAAAAPTPAKHALELNYPNPFNPGTTIEYVVGGISAQTVRLVIYNSLGQHVRELIDARQAPGAYQVQWNGENDHDLPVVSGVYFSRLQINNEVHIRKMALSR